METLYTIIVLLVFAFFSWLFHYISNSYPLTENEIKDLATHKRFHDVVKHFDFQEYDITINPEFKKKIKHSGEFYLTEKTNNLDSFPSFASSLLKGKKHEWIILAIVKNNDVIGFWINKGSDNANVSAKIGYLEMFMLLKKYNADTLLSFHNHPNAILEPSDTDISSANNSGIQYNGDGVNYLAFISGRGKYKQYAWWIVDDLLPIGKYMNDIKAINGTRKSINYNLNMELRRMITFKKNIFNANKVSINIF